MEHDPLASCDHRLHEEGRTCGALGFMFLTLTPWLGLQPCRLEQSSQMSPHVSRPVDRAPGPKLARARRVASRTCQSCPDSQKELGAPRDSPCLLKRSSPRASSRRRAFQRWDACAKCMLSGVYCQDCGKPREITSFRKCLVYVPRVDFMDQFVFVFLCSS